MQLCHGTGKRRCCFGSVSEDLGKELGLGDLKFRIFGREINASFWIKYFIVFNSLFLVHLKIQMKREVCSAEKHSHSQFCKHCRKRRDFATSLHTVKNEIKLRK